MESAAHTEPRKQELSDYDKGYLDGLLEASRHAGRKRAEVYKADAERYLRSIGLDWSVSVSRA